MTKAKIRIKDIAEQAGVSVGTVDRVLHNRGEVAEETKNKILEIEKVNNNQALKNEILSKYPPNEVEANYNIYMRNAKKLNQAIKDEGGVGVNILEGNSKDFANFMKENNSDAVCR